MDYGEQACIPFDGVSAGDFVVTFTKVTGIYGDIEKLGVNTNNLDGARKIDVSTVVEGDAPLAGNFRLSFRGSLTDPIDVSGQPSDLADQIDSVLESLDSIEKNGVNVTHVEIPHSGHEKIFAIEFIGDGVGGSVLSLEAPSTFNHLTGSKPEIQIITKGESYYAKNGFDLFVSRGGNSLDGSFQLKL